MTSLTFRTWRRLGGRSIAPNPVGGRAEGSLGILASDSTNLAVPGTARFALYGPGDVEGLDAGAILSRFPRPGQIDAEALYAPYVAFHAPDLPWRYSPAGPSGASDLMAPWLALLVVTPAEVEARPGPGLVRISGAGFAANPQAPRNAHVQVGDGGGPEPTGDPGGLSRVLSFRTLLDNSDYLALLVGSFRADGGPAWGVVSETVTVYDEWWFRTGPAGTFETLARALHPADGLDGFGTIAVEVGDGAAELVNVRGALTRIAAVSDPPPPPDATEQLEALLTIDPEGDPDDGLDAGGRRYVRPPRYGDSWMPDAVAGAAAAGWVTQLATDPTHRVVAGLGLQAAIDLQDEISSAAADRFGATESANQRIAGAVAGLAVGRSQWDRRVPLERNERISVLGLAAGRVLARGADGVVKPLLDHATGPDRTLPPALFSTAAHRILRRGAARLRHASPGATSILDAANQVRPAVRRPEDAPAGQRDRHSAGVSHADTIVAHVVGELGPFEVAGTPVERGDELARALGNVVVGERVPAGVPVVSRLGSERPPRTLPRPVDLDAFDGALVDAFDPRRNPAVILRIRATIEPDDDPEPLAPREPCVDLDLPAWRYLRDRQPEWLLPGASTLTDGEVVGLATNPTFVDAFLVGENTGALGELRWRNLRPASGCTPLRKFWDRSVAVGDGYEAADDIVGINQWVAATGGVDPRSLPLGDPSHSPTGAGRQLVVAFRTELFRRYPNTFVYLASPAPPVVPAEADLRTRRTLPSFMAQASPTLVLFAFPVVPEELQHRWVVVEQQPPGIRFERRFDPVLVSSPAIWAKQSLVKPVRAVLAGDSLAAV